MTATEASPSRQICTLHTESLVKRYGRQTIVDHVDISVRSGEVVGLLGPNGAGKTTCFYIIVGLVSPSSGKVFLNEVDITRCPMYQRARQGIGYLPQEPSVFTRLSVEDNIRAIAETLPLKREEREVSIQKRLDELDLSHLAKQEACTLSGGERRRLEISRALVTQPKFLLMDEPFSGVDPISVGEVQEIIITLKHRGISVLITDHNVRETLKIVDRAYVLNQGRILFEGASEVLIEDPRCREIYLGESFNL